MMRSKVPAASRAIITAGTFALVTITFYSFYNVIFMLQIGSLTEKQKFHGRRLDQHGFNGEVDSQQQALLEALKNYRLNVNNAEGRRPDRAKQFDWSILSDPTSDEDVVDTGGRGSDAMEQLDVLKQYFQGTGGDPGRDQDGSPSVSSAERSKWREMFTKWRDERRRRKGVEAVSQKGGDSVGLTQSPPRISAAASEEQKQLQMLQQMMVEQQPEQQKDLQQQRMQDWVQQQQRQFPSATTSMIDSEHMEHRETQKKQKERQDHLDQQRESYKQMRLQQKYKELQERLDPQLMQILLDQKGNYSLVKAWMDYHEILDRENKYPVVLTEFKLMFFPIAKVGSSVIMKLLRRMAGLADWSVSGGPKALPYHRKTNGLKYLIDFTPEEQQAMLSSPDYTIAIFVRQPHERFLSAYLDKAIPGSPGKPSYVEKHRCCRNPEESDSIGARTATPQHCAKHVQASLRNFLEFTQRPCGKDPHWEPQSQRIPAELWPYINYVGYLRSAQDDMKRLLDTVDRRRGNKDNASSLWNQFASFGWGRHNNETLLESRSSYGGGAETNGRSKLAVYYDSVEVWDDVQQVYQLDYDLFFPNDQTRQDLFSSSSSSSRVE